MGVTIKGKTFTSTEQVTSTKLHQLVDDATFDTTAVDNTSTALSGGAIIVKDGGITPAKTSSAFAYGYRNLIINGRGFINQRGYVSGTATTGSNQYTVDRWRVVTSGQNLTFSTSGITTTMTAPAGGCEQVIEGLSIAGGTHIITFTGTATCTVDGVTRTSGQTFTLTAGTNCTVRFSSGTFTNVQVEAGSVASVYENRAYGLELALCQRYFYSIKSTSTGNYICGGGFSTATQAQGHVTFPVTMRVAPTVTGFSVSSPSHINVSGASTLTLSALTISGGVPSTTGVGLLGTVSGATTGVAGWFFTTTSGQINFDGAEL